MNSATALNPEKMCRVASPSPGGGGGPIASPANDCAGGASGGSSARRRPHRHDSHDGKGAHHRHGHRHSSQHHHRHHHNRRGGGMLRWMPRIRLHLKLRGIFSVIWVAMFVAYELSSGREHRRAGRYLEAVRDPTSYDACASASSLTDFLELHSGMGGGGKGSRKLFRGKSRPPPAKFYKENPVCPSSTYNAMHVAIPFRNLDASTIGDCVRSVLTQDYPKGKVNVWVYDDGSDMEGAQEILEEVCGPSRIVDFIPPPSTKGRDQGTFHDAVRASREVRSSDGDHPRTVCYRASSRLGPGGGKYYLLKLVNELSKPNDIVMVLDGDDSLNMDDALRVVNGKYVDDNVWFTYGSYEGKWGEQIVDLDPAIRSGSRPFRPREQDWLYGHPRTFKSHLLDHIEASDYQFQDGTWLLKGTDRGFVYRMLELSGQARVGYIPEKIYKVRLFS